MQQDVATRWNSTFYMVESLLEQRRPISAYGADHDLPATLTANQWALLQKKLSLFWYHLRKWPKQISSSTSSVAEVIPSVTCSGDQGGHRYKNNENHPSWGRQETIRNYRGGTLVCSCSSLGSMLQRQVCLFKFFFMSILIIVIAILSILVLLVIYYFKWYCINAIFKDFLHLI